MEVKPLREENGHNRFEVKAEWSEVAADYEDVLLAYSQVKITGFRPGKAPREVIESHFEKKILEDFSHKIAERLGREALRVAGAETLGGLEIAHIECGKGKAVAFTAGYRPMPEIKLPDLASLTIGGKETDVRDRIAGRLLEQIKFDLPENMILAELARDGAPQNGDASAKQAAGDRLRLMLILKKIAREQGVGVTEEDVEQRLREKAAEFGKTPETLRKELKREGGWNRLKDLLLAEETLTFLVELSQGK